MNKFACGNSVLSKRKRGFTLSEVMIVLVVIGVITGILLPTAIQSTPDENVMKFKKGYSTLGMVIRELVTSDKYYKDGDLGIKPNGDIVDSATYFCETFADVLNIKSMNCSKETLSNPFAFTTRLDVGYKIPETGDPGDPDGEYTGQVLTVEINQKEADKACKNNTKAGEEIITNDDIIYYQTSPGHHFGWLFTPDNCLGEYCNNRYYGGKSQNGLFFHRDSYGFDRIYKIFCMDIDGIEKGEDPFGFGIRADGKILPGARADEWINKSIQKED